MFHKRLPKIRITETEEVALAIKAGLEKWNDLSRAQVVERLIVTASDAIVAEQTSVEKAAERRAAVERMLGSRPDYPKDYLEELRKEWPE